MERSRWLLVAALALAVVGVWGLVLARLAGDDGQPSTSPLASLPAGPTMRASAPPASTDPSATTRPPMTPAPTSTPSPTATPAPSVAPTEAAGDPRLRFVEFQLRLADDADDVQGLNQALVEAAQAEDDGATVDAAVAMLDFVDRERDWLAGHPPAACYEEAHDAAGRMLRAYGAVAEAAIEYADATGLGRLEALGALLEAADVAGDALRRLGAAVEDATCRT